MFYKLHEKLLLRGWQKIPNAVVEQGVGRPVFITAREMDALKLCNGMIDVDLPLVPQELRDLVKLAAEVLDWKKSTTYTVLRRLCEKGLFANENGIVSAKMNKDQWKGMQSESFVKETFGGSLPMFLAAFTSRKKLTEDEIEALRKMIAEADGK